MANSFLVCEPTGFSINYSINPWMDKNVGQANNSLATYQWIKFVIVMIDAGSTILRMAPGKTQLPDLVFVANAGLMIENRGCILSNFKYDERKKEVDAYKKIFSDLKIWSVNLPEHITFEGAGDALFADKLNILWMGYGYRTDQAAALYIQELVGSDISVRSLQLMDPKYYHLDTCFCPLETSDGIPAVLYYPDAFSFESNAKINLFYRNYPKIPVTSEEAADFSCNAVQVNNTIICNKMSDRLKELLGELGLTVLESPLTEFMKAGGSAKCLTLRL